MPRSSSTWTNGAFSTTTGNFSTGLRMGGNSTQATVTLPSGVYVDDSLTRTVEFWFKYDIIGTSGRSGKIVSTQSLNTGGYPTYSNHMTLTTYGDGNLYLIHDTFEYQFGNIGTGWHHMVWQWNGANNFRCWLDGVHKISATHSINQFNALNFGNKWAGDGSGPTSTQYVYFDEVRISSVNRYSHSTTNFTSPTTAFTNDADTLALFHMESTSQSDDTQDPITEGSATLTSAFTMTSTVSVVDPYLEAQYFEQDYFEGDAELTDYFYDGYIDENYLEGDAVTGTTQEASATLNVAFTQSSSAGIVKTVTGIEFVFSNNVISITSTRLRDSTITYPVAFTVNAQGTKTLSGNSDLQSQFSQNNTVLRIKQLSISISGAMNASLTASALKNHTAVLDSSATLTATASRFTGTEQTLDSIIALSLQGARSRSYQSSLQSQISISATATRIQTTNSTLNSAFSISTDTQVVKTANATLTSVVSQSTTGNRTRNVTANISSAFTLVCDFSEIDDFIISCNSAFTQTTTAQRIRSTVVSLVNQTTVSTTATKIKQGTASISSVFALTPAPKVNVIFEPTFQTTGVGDSDSLDSLFTLGITGDLTKGFDIALQGAFTPSITVLAQRSAESLFVNTFTITCNVSKLKEAEINLSSISSLTASGSIPFYKFQLVDLGSPNVTFNGEMQVTGVAQSGKQIGNAYNFGVNPDEATATSNIFSMTASEDWTFEFFVDPGSSFPTNGKIFGFSNFELIQMQRNGSNWEIKVRRSNGTYASLTTSYNQFNAHYAIQRIGNKIELYSEGFFRSESNVAVNATLSSGLPNITTQSDFDIDEIRFTLGTRYSNANAGSTLDYTIPTAPLSNDAGTIFTFHMDDNVADSGLEDVSATLTTTATLTLEFIVTAEVTLNSAFTQSCTATKVLASSATLNSAVALDVTANKIKQFAIELDAFNTQLTAASKIGDFLVTFDVSFTKDFSAIKTTDITKTLSSEGTLSADISRTRSTSSTLNAANTVSVTAQRTRSGDATIDSVLSISTDAVKTTDTSSDLNTVISLTAESLPIRQFASALSVTFSTQTNAVITADAQSTLNSAFTQSAEPVADLEGSADLDSAFTISLTPTVTKTFVIELDAFNTVISTVAKIGDFLVTFDTAFSISATARVIRAEDLDFQSEFSQSLTANRIQQGASTLNAVFSQTATGVNQYELEADLDSAVTLNTNAVKTVSAQISIASAGDFVLTVAVSRTTDIDLINTTSVVVVAERFRFTPTTMASVSTMSINAGIRADAQAVLSVQFGIVAPTDVVHIDELVYVISAETREYTIKSEQRTVTIDSETREYTVKK